MTGTTLDPSVTAIDFFGNLTGNVTGGISGGAVSATTIAASGAISGAAGTVSLPEYTFTGDLDSGIYRINANNIGVAVNATKILDIGTTGMAVVGTLTATLTGNVTGNVIGNVTTTALTDTGTLTVPLSTVQAAGTNQAGATLIGDVMMVRVTVTASTEGVRLPSAATGRAVFVAVPGTVGVKVYPFSNDKIDSGSTNAAVALVAGKGSLYVALNTSQWYTMIKGA